MTGVGVLVGVLVMVAIAIVAILIYRVVWRHRSRAEVSPEHLVVCLTRGHPWDIGTRWGILGFLNRFTGTETHKCHRCSMVRRQRFLWGRETGRRYTYQRGHNG